MTYYLHLDGQQINTIRAKVNEIHPASGLQNTRISVENKMAASADGGERTTAGCYMERELLIYSEFS
jgi:hypothetical protein